MSQPPQTGDPRVDETLASFHATVGESLQDRAAAAVAAQRALQERLTQTSPGQGEAASGMQQVAGAGRPTA